MWYAVAAVGDSGDVAALGCCNDGGGWHCGWSLWPIVDEGERGW